MCHHGRSSQETGCRGKKDAVMQELLSKIMFYLNKRAAGKMQIEVILYSMNLESWQIRWSREVFRN